MNGDPVHDLDRCDVQVELTSGATHRGKLVASTYEAWVQVGSTWVRLRDITDVREWDRSLEL